MRAQYADLTNDEEAGLGAGGGAAGADLRAAGGLVSLGEKQPARKIFQNIYKGYGIWAECHLRDSSSVEKSYSVVSLSPRTMLSASSTLMSRLSWGSTVWLVIVTDIMTWCQR